MSELAVQRFLDLQDRLIEPPVVRFGHLNRIVGMTIEASGLDAPMGSQCSVEKSDGSRVEAQVVGFSNDLIYMMPFQGTIGLKPGARVTLRASSDSAFVGDGALGRVLDAYGNPLDGLSPPRELTQRPLISEPINPMSREPIDQVLDVGIRAINALLTIGCGQRIGLIAGSGVGKSVLLGMMTKFTQADVIVIGLIGERGREVKEFIEQTLGYIGLRRAVVIAAPADNSPLLRIRAANLAHCYAEHFKEKGQNVLLLVDSLTRVAHAQREIGLAVGEPPTTKGYPSSVFSLIPKMIERTGTGAKDEGSITAIYTVLAEGDDLNDPIVDISRASLDGQIVLTRELADEGHFPAIDLSGSVSRLLPVLASEAHLKLASSFRRYWAIYQQNRDLIQVGAYQRGSNLDLDKAILLREENLKFLRQSMHEPAEFQQSLTEMKEAIDG